MNRRLQLRYGFVGKALAWQQSYLEGRIQRVGISDASSKYNTCDICCPARFSAEATAIVTVRTAHWGHHYSAWTLFSSLR